MTIDDRDKLYRRIMASYHEYLRSFPLPKFINLLKETYGVEECTKMTLQQLEHLANHMEAKIQEKKRQNEN